MNTSAASSSPISAQPKRAGHRGEAALRAVAVDALDEGQRSAAAERQREGGVVGRGRAGGSGAARCRRAARSARWPAVAHDQQRALVAGQHRRAACRSSARRRRSPRARRPRSPGPSRRGRAVSGPSSSQSGGGRREQRPRSSRRARPPAITRPPRSAKARSARASSPVSAAASITAIVPSSPSERVGRRLAQRAHADPVALGELGPRREPCGLVANEDDAGPLGLGATASTSAATTLMPTSSAEHSEAGAGRAALGQREAAHARLAQHALPALAARRLVRLARAAARRRRSRRSRRRRARTPGSATAVGDLAGGQRRAVLDHLARRRAAAGRRGSAAARRSPTRRPRRRGRRRARARRGPRGAGARARGGADGGGRPAADRAAREQPGDDQDERTEQRGEAPAGRRGGRTARSSKKSTTGCSRSPSQRSRPRNGRGTLAAAEPPLLQDLLRLRARLGRVRRLGERRGVRPAAPRRRAAATAPSRAPPAQLDVPSVALAALGRWRQRIAALQPARRGRAARWLRSAGGAEAAPLAAARAARRRRARDGPAAARRAVAGCGGAKPAAAATRGGANAAADGGAS